MSREYPTGDQVDIEHIGLQSILFTVQQHLEYPLFIDMIPAVAILYKKYGSNNLDNENILYLRSHSKAYRPGRDGANNLLVRLQVFKEFQGVYLEEVIIPIIPEYTVIQWIPKLVKLADYLMPRHTPLNTLATPEILAKFLLFWISDKLIGINPGDLLDFSTIEISDIRKPLWGDPEAIFSFNFVYHSQIKTGQFLCTRRIRIPFFQMD